MFRAFTYDELMQRDKANLDIFWLKDDSLEDSANLPAPEVLAINISKNTVGAQCIDPWAQHASPLYMIIFTHRGVYGNSHEYSEKGRNELTCRFFLEILEL